MWELACLRWHHLGVSDVPSCLHRRQASSHRKASSAFALAFDLAFNTQVGFQAAVLLILLLLLLLLLI